MGHGMGSFSLDFGLGTGEDYIGFDYTTGQPINSLINPLTGLPLSASTTQNLSNYLLIGAVVLGAYLLFKK